MTSAAARRPNTRSADTRTKLLETAERLFALEGIDAVSLRRVATEAGQRNCNALQYHFGTRELLIDAIVEARMTPLNQRRRALLEEALGRTKGKPSVEDLVVALVVPMVEQLLDVERGSSYVRFMGELFARGEAKGALATPRPWNDAFFETVSHLRRALSSIPEDVLGTRIFLMAGQMVQATAAAELEVRDLEGDARAARVTRFAEQLVDYVAGALAAPSRAPGGAGTRTVGPGPVTSTGCLVSRRRHRHGGVVGHRHHRAAARTGRLRRGARPPRGGRLARAVEAHGAKAHVVAADLAEGADTTHLAQSAPTRGGPAAPASRWTATSPLRAASTHPPTARARHQPRRDQSGHGGGHARASHRAVERAALRDHPGLRGHAHVRQGARSRARGPEDRANRRPRAPGRVAQPGAPPGGARGAEGRQRQAPPGSASPRQR
ncbi:MAG: TetR family transcriptional regulator [Sandaracinaceae bacterium]|nr:TetR family transcriptional regulator [Sandaracinaceae bacterium]